MTSPLEDATTKGYIGTATDQAAASTYEAPHGGGGQVSALTATVDAPNPLGVYGGDPDRALLQVQTGQNAPGDPINGVDLLMFAETTNVDLGAWPGNAACSITSATGYVALNANDTVGQSVSIVVPGTQTDNVIEFIGQGDTRPFVVKPSGDVVLGQGASVVLLSPNGTAYRLAVANDGTLSATAA
ncbi:MAG TPA: hypothetical protein VE326_11550 [Candidatus Binatia bacterium]|nr:hypothetical protein [Candidatus Binatia bacterium]